MEVDKIEEMKTQYSIMGCSKKFKLFSKVFVQVLVIKFFFSGFDVFSDGSTANELYRHRSPLKEATR